MSDTTLPLPGGNGTPRQSVPGYELLEEVGRGGMGVVYKARQTRLNRDVALKMIRGGDHAGPEELARFRIEAEAVARLQHPHIIQIHDVGELDGCPYFSLEFVDGGSLAQRLRGTPLPPRTAAALVEVLAGAMHYAHTQGIVHRDLKPGNVLLQKRNSQDTKKTDHTTERDGSASRSSVSSLRGLLLGEDSFLPKITDFGLAKRLDGDAGQTQSGQVLGTPSYMAPEQAGGVVKQIGPAADIYALGAVLYECLTGRPPFRAATPMETVLLVIAEEPVPPRQLQPRTPRDLETICLKCLQKDARKRFASAADLADDLRRFAAGEPIQARAVGQVERAWRWCRRRPALAALLLLALLLLFVGLPGVTGLWWHAEGQRTLAVEKTAEAVRERERAREQEKIAVKNATETQKQRQIAERQRDNTYTVQQRDGLAAAARALGQGNFIAAQDALSRVPDSRQGWEWFRRMHEISLSPRPREIVGTHHYPITAALFSRDGRVRFTSEFDGILTRWDGGTEIPVLLPEELWSEQELHWRRVHLRHRDVRPRIKWDCFTRLCWVRDGAVLAGASRRGKGVLWDLETGRREVLLAVPEALTAVAASADGRHLLFGTEDGGLYYQDRQQGGWRRRPANSAVLAAIFLAPHYWIVGREDGSVTVLNLAADTVLEREALRGPVWDLAVAPDGKTLAVACGDNPLPTFHIRREGERVQLHSADHYFLPPDDAGPTQAFHAVRFTPDGLEIGAGDDHGRIVIWKRDKQTLRLVYPDQQANGGVLNQLPSFLRRRVAALEFTPDGALFTVGSDTSLKRWDIAVVPGITELRVSPAPSKAELDAAKKAPRGVPAIRFDPVEHALLYAGTDDGRLTLWDSRAKIKRTEQHAHDPGTFASLDLAVDAGLVATCGRDRKIRFWRRTGNDLREEGRPIECAFPLRSVTLSPDGTRVAAYDEQDEINLWDVTSRRLLTPKPVSMREDRALPTEGGLVAFSRDGKTIAAAGPSQKAWLLSGTTLEVLDRPYLTAGLGVTAFAWHPTDGWVMAGDTAGQLRVAPSSVHPQRDNMNLPSRTAGLSFSPDGSRLAAVSDRGTIYVGDLRWMGKVLTLRSSHTDVTGLTFDPAGRRLALAHRDGVVAIWETGDAVAPPEAQPVRRWPATTLVRAGDGSPSVFEVRPQALCFDGNDRLCTLYVRTDVNPQNRVQPIREVVVLGREVAGRFENTVVEEIDASKGAQGSTLKSSIALTWHGDDLVGVVRLPASRKDTVFGQLTQIRLRADGTGPLQKELLERPNNWGTFAHLVSTPSGKPTLVHFGFSGYFFWTTCWDENRAEWDSDVVSRPGDGNGMVAVSGPDGRFHAVFRPNRFDRDPSPLTYLRLAGPRLRQEEARETVDPSPDMGHASIALVGGIPTVLYVRQSTDGRIFELQLARRTAAGWERSTVFPAFGTLPSNLVTGPDGSLHFAYVDATRRRACVVSQIGGVWRSEAVWETDEGVISVEAILFDSRGRLAVVVRRVDDDRPQEVLLLRQPDLSNAGERR